MSVKKFFAAMLSLTIAVLLAASDASLSAATYYVRATGADGNNGTSPATAFKTITKAQSVAIAGDTVYVGAGTYPNRVAFSKDGTVTSPITFYADTAGTYTGDAGIVVVNGNADEGFEIKDDNYLTFVNFTITGNIGVYIEASTGTVLRNCTIYSTTLDGIYAKTASGLKIERCHILNVGSDGLYAQGGSFEMVNTLIENPVHHGISTSSLTAASSIQHTTIYSADMSGVYHNNGTLSVYNSIISSCTSKGFERIAGTLTHDYNIAYNNTAGNFVGTTQSTNEWTVDPKFTNAIDFHPQPTSPALEKGTASTITVDKDNNPRPVGPKPDLGCYEGQDDGSVGTGATYFVRMTGNDANDGLSPATAFKTIKKAATMLHAGEKVYIGAGTYTDSVSVKYSGTPGNPVQFIGDIAGTFTGDAGAAIMSGGSGTAFQIVLKDYITISNLQFGGLGSSGGSTTGDDLTSDTNVAVTLFESTNNCQISNCQFKNGKDAIRVKNSDVTLSSCVVDNYQSNGIYVEGATSKLTLYNCTVSNCGDIGILIKKCNTVLIEDSIISNNTAEGIRTESDSTSHTFTIRRSQIIYNKEGFHIHGVSAVTIENCLVARNTGTGINFHGGDSAAVVNHCTIAYNGLDGANLDHTSTCSCKNCIVAYNNDDGLVKGGSSHSYNLVYGNKDKNYDGTAAGIGCLNVNPKFNSLTDYHVQSTSPSIDKGTGTLNVDLEGNPRPKGTAVDLGCYEQPTASGSSTTGNDYYVRAGGNDSKNGLTPPTAFRTITKAVSVVVPGDRVWIGAGTYVETLDLTNKAGTATATITFTADTTGVKTGDGGTITVHGGFYVRTSSYLIFDGFAARASNLKPTWSSCYAGGYIDSSSRITFQNVTFTNGEYGVFSNAGTNLMVSDCTSTGQTKHGYAFQNNSTADLTNCTASGNTLAGFYALNSNVSIWGCTATSNGSRGYHYSTSRGTIDSSSATSNPMAAELTGANNDRTTLTVTGLSISGCTQGALLLTHCTVDGIGAGTAMASGGTYTASLNNSRLTLSNATINGTATGITASGASIVTLTNCTISSCSADGVYLDGSNGSLTNCTVSSCGTGARGVNNSTLNVTGTTFNSITNWAINNTGYGLINNSTVNLCGNGICMIGAATRGDVSITGTKIQGTTREGLMAVRCTGSLIAGNDKLSKSGAYGAYLLDSEMTFTGVEIYAPQYGVQSYGSNLEFVGGSITNCQNDAVYSDNSTTTLRNCTLSNCRQGVWGISNSTLVAQQVTFANHTSWGINLAGYGTIDACQINTCAKGAYLAGVSSPGDITISATSIQGTTGEGIAAIYCTGDIVAGADKLSKGGAYGIYLSNATLNAPNVQIAGPQYGVQSYNSTLNLSGASITGCSLDGVYGDRATTTLTNSTISNCRYGIRSENNGALTASGCTIANCTSWGIQHAGTGAITDCTSDKNYQGLNLTGATTMGDITLSNTKIQGTTREGLYAVRCTGSLVAGNDKLSKAGDYGAYLSQSNLNLTGITITGALYGVMSYSSTLNLSGATITDVTNDAIYGSAATTTLSNCTLARCKNGVNSESNGTLNATNSTIDACTIWGVVHTGYATITGCTVNNCYQGMYLTGVNANTDIVLSNTAIQGTTKDGLIATKCSGTIVAGTDKLSKGGTYGAYLSQSNLNLSGVTITGPQRGIVAMNSTFTLTNASISGTTQTGVYTEGTTATVSNSTVSSCGSRGVDCQLDSTLNATALVVQNCADWGLAVSGFGSINSSQLLNNQSGANLVGKTTRGNITMSNLVISGTTTQGLIATRCTGTVQGSGGTLSGGGAAGVNSTDSQLTLTNAMINGATNGVQSTQSDLTVRNVTITNATKGVYSSLDNNLVLDLTKISNCSAWGVHQFRGSAQTSNCLMTNVASGFNLDQTTQSKIWNNTVITTGLYGIYQNAGNAEIKNTIISGTSGNTGIYKTSGTLTCANNLVYGYATGVSGFTADANTIFKSPRFTNAAGGDYTLAKGSPAINAGADLAGYVDADLAGSARPAYKRWEIGAYEYLPQNASLRILQWAEKK